MKEINKNKIGNFLLAIALMLLVSCNDSSVNKQELKYQVCFSDGKKDTLILKGKVGLFNRGWNYNPDILVADGVTVAKNVKYIKKIDEQKQ